MVRKSILVGFLLVIVLGALCVNPLMGVLVSGWSGSVENTGFEPWYYYVAGLVNSASGNLFFSVRDVSIRARGFDIEIVRAYNSHRNGTSTGFGFGWTFNYHVRLMENGAVVSLVEGDGSIHEFTSIGGGQYSSPPGIHYRLIENLDDSFTLWFKDGSRYNFDSSGVLLDIVDKNGNHLTFSYAGGKLTRVEDDSGLALVLNYNLDGKISGVVDPLGREISYEYDGDGNLFKVTDAMGFFTLYFYEKADPPLQSIVNRFGGMISFNYLDDKVVEIRTGLYNYSTGLPSISFRTYSIDYGFQKVVVTNARGFKTTIQMNENGNPTEIIDALGGVTSQVWNSDMSVINFTDANGHSYTYAYDSYGNLLNQTDPLDYSTLYAWENVDSDTRYISLLVNTTNARGFTTKFDYDERGNWVKTTDAAGNYSHNFYDECGSPIKYTCFRGYNTTYLYNVHEYMVNSTDASGNVTRYSYDIVGRLTSLTDANNHTTTYMYDKNDRLTELIDGLGNSTRYFYNEEGTLMKEVDANGRERESRNNLVDQLDLLTDASDNATSYSYDPCGNLISRTDANGNTVTYSYDVLDRLIATTDTLGHKTNYSYDAVGNLISRIDANDNCTTYEYDALNRIVFISYPDGSNITYTYDPEGNIIQVTNTGGLHEITYNSYDELSRLVSRTVDYGSFTKNINYTYDEVGNRATMTDPNGGVKTYSYDNVGRLLSITDPSGDVTTYQYDSAGRRIGVKYPNGVGTTYTYDAVDRLLNLTIKNSTGAVVSSYFYSYDDVGNRLSMIEADGSITYYRYGALYRLINVTYPSGNSTYYTYDEVGNRLAESNETSTILYTYDKDNRLLTAGTTSYSYDNNGNLIGKTRSGTSTYYEYDYENRLTKVTLADASQVAFQYSVEGDRLSKTTSSGTIYYFYDSEDILMELDATGLQKARYTHGPGIDEPICMNRSGVASYYHFDGLGSVISLTNTDENVVATYQYDVFGTIVKETGEVANPYRFASREYDEEIGLYYYRARYYDPEVGRFISKDPVDGTNLYVYVGNNPVNNVDPTGKGGRFSEFLKAAKKKLGTIGVVICIGCLGGIIALEVICLVYEGKSREDWEKCMCNELKTNRGVKIFCGIHSVCQGVVKFLKKWLKCERFGGNSTYSIPYGPTAVFTEVPETPYVGEVVTFDPSPSQPGCNGTHIRPITTCTWNFDDNTPPTTTPYPQPVTHTYTKAGEYNVTLTVTAPGAIPETHTTWHIKHVTGLLPHSPVAKFTEEPEEPRVYQTVSFDASTSQPGFDGDDICDITEYHWDFGDGETGTGKTVTHVYTKPGKYLVSLTVYAPSIPPYIDPQYTGTNTTDTTYHIKTVIGGYSIPISTYTTATPLATHVIMIATITAITTLTRRIKTRRKKEKSKSH